MSQQVLHEDHLPAVFDLYNQPVLSAANIKHGVGINEVSMGINELNFVDVVPCGPSSDLVPLGNRAFEGVVSRNCILPGALADHVHLIRRFASCEVSTIFANCEFFYKIQDVGLWSK